MASHTPRPARVGMTVSAFRALKAASTIQLQAMLVLEEALLAVSHEDVQAELRHRAKLVHELAAADLARRRLRGHAWAIPINLPFRPWRKP